MFNQFGKDLTSLKHTADVQMAHMVTHVLKTFQIHVLMVNNTIQLIADCQTITLLNAVGALHTCLNALKAQFGITSILHAIGHHLTTTIPMVNLAVMMVIRLQHLVMLNLNKLM